jgi:hypothetical protein
MFLSRFFTLQAAFLLAFPIFGHATVLTGHVTGSCDLDYVDGRHVCSAHVSGDYTANATTPILGLQFRADEQLVYDWKNDATTASFSPDEKDPNDRIKGSNSSSFPAKCGHTYKLQLYVRATDDGDFKKMGETLEIQCPRRIPK